MPHDVPCPDCGYPMVLRPSPFPFPDGSPRQFYGCYPCRNALGAHPDGTPVGIPGDAATRAHRIRAHAAFDRLWKKGPDKRMGRISAYKHLARIMGKSKDEAHIGMFNEVECERLIVLMAIEYGEIPQPDR